MIRYFPSLDSSAHYTGVPLSGSRILQVKSPDHVNDRKVYASKEEWMATLPGSPTMEQMVTEDDHGWKVPSNKYTINRCNKWLIRLYDLIRETDPLFLLRADVRDAYNHLAEVLKEMNEIQYNGWHTIRRTVSLCPEQIHPFRKLDGKFRYVRVLPNTNEEQSLMKIYHAYFPLYQLIHEKVVPYATRKYETVLCDRRIKDSQRKINHLKKKMDECAKMISYHEQTIQQHRQSLQNGTQYAQYKAATR